MKKTVCGHEGQLLAVGAGLLGASRVELELFSALDLDRLVKTPGLRLVGRDGGECNCLLWELETLVRAQVRWQECNCLLWELETLVGWSRLRLVGRDGGECNCLLWELETPDL